MNSTTTNNTGKLEEKGSLQQYVTFLIGGETYGVEVLQVQEIIGMTPITFVPNAMNFMKGVINLRGTVVPVIDMRLKLNLDERQYDVSTVIIVVEVKERMIGIIVDSVSDVVSLPVNSIQDTPHFTSKIETDFVKGIGQIDENLVIILDVSRILTTAEIKSINTSAD